MAVTDKMTPEGKRFFKELEELCRMEVCVGYQDDGTMKEYRDSEGKIVESKETTLAMVAAWNELGTESIPERPFLRQTIENHSDEIKKAAQELAGKLAGGGSAQDCLSGIGALTVGFVRDEIDNGKFAKNDEDTTVKRKGSNKPLIDTGQLRQSVHYVIREKGGGA